MRRTLLLLLLLLLLAAPAGAQPARPTCADTPARCDKEVLLLKDEVEQRRQALAALLAANEALARQATATAAPCAASHAGPPPVPTKEP